MTGAAGRAAPAAPRTSPRRSVLIRQELEQSVAKNAAVWRGVAARVRTWDQLKPNRRRICSSWRARSGSTSSWPSAVDEIALRRVEPMWGSSAKRATASSAGNPRKETSSYLSGVATTDRHAVTVQEGHRLGVDPADPVVAGGRRAAILGPDRQPGVVAFADFGHRGGVLRAVVDHHHRGTGIEGGQAAVEPLGAVTDRDHHRDLGDIDVDSGRGDRVGHASLRPSKGAGCGGRLMTEVAGEAGDGMLVHGFSTERYLREVSLPPRLEHGAAKAGKTRGDLTVSYPGFVVTGVDEAARAAADKAVTPTDRLLRLHPGVPPGVGTPRVG